MGSSRLNVALLVLLLASLSANWLLRPDPTRPRQPFILSNMVEAVPAESFTASPVFRSGQTEQAPPAGTVPRPAPAPPESSEQTLARGEVVYTTFCVPCHGAGGNGDGPVAMRGFPAPPSLLADNAKVMTDDQMNDLIARGRKNMPAYAVQVGPEDRRRVIAFVRKLQAPQG